MSNWTQSGTWRTIGKLKEIFCIHKDQFCFSALIYLKIYQRDGSLYFITNIFKTNDTDYLFLGPGNNIQGLGRKFLKILGEEAKNMPVHLLLENPSNSPIQEEFQHDKVYRKVFMGVKGSELRVESHRENMSQLLQVHQKEEQEDSFYYWIKSNCSEKYYVEFSVQKYRMGGISFDVLQLRESRLI